MRFRAFFAILAFAAAAQAQPAYLVRDIVPQGGRGPSDPPISRPHQLTPTPGGKLFFQEGDEFGGSIWATDGTPGGTLRLPGNCRDSNCLLGPKLLGSLRNLALWVEPNPGKVLLWRSDGTWAGTFPLNHPAVLDVSSLANRGSDAPYSSVVGGFLYFRGCTEENGCELWRTNGTREGTRLVKDLEPGSSSSGPGWMTAVGNKLFFITAHDLSLWVSDGTAAGTSRVRELAGVDGTSIRNLAVAGGKLFFIARQNGEEELWVSDGTAAGTRAVSRFAPESPFVWTAWVKPIGNRVYFLADDVEHGMELWRSDGTAAGTVRVTDFGYHKPFGPEETILASQIAEAGGRIIFLATDGLSGFKYWVSSGTPESTAVLAEVCVQAPCDDPGYPDPWLVLAPVGGRVVFLVRGERPAEHLAWSTDGTPGGTGQLLDLAAGPPVALSGAVFFSAGGDLWRTDGTPEGTRRFADLAPPNFAFSGELASSGGRIYFRASGPYGTELWASDGRPGGSMLITDLFPAGQPGSRPHDLTALEDRLFFFAFAPGRLDLWRSSGTTESTVALGVPASSSSCSNAPLSSLTAAGSKAFYLRAEPSCTLTLWATDGTAAGTVQLPANVVGGSGAQPTPLIAHQGSLLFWAREGDGVFLWKSDGTPQGTGRAFDLPAEARIPSHLTSVGADLYFVASDSEGMDQVWRSDGTTAGTRRLSDFPESFSAFLYDPQFTRVGPAVFFQGPEPFSTDPKGLWATDGTLAGTRELLSDAFETEGLFAFQGTLYFFAAHFGEWSLWRSDGTAAGTVPVKVLGFKDFSSQKIEPVVVGNQFFFALNSVQGRELWRSDGTASGTRVVRDIFPGSDSSLPAELVAGGGKLYFTADDGLHGRELWESDGTEAGTRMVQDIFPLSYSSNPSELTVVAGRLFFQADDGVTGPELWALPLGPSSACQPSPTHLCLGGGRFRVEAHWKDFSGNAGRGQAVGLTPDTGYFWFFDPANVETIVKVLDGRGVNDHHWVFYGALSNVEYSITVTDTQTGRTRRYFNPSGHFASVGDSQGFGPSWDQAEKASSVAPAAGAPLVSERTDPEAKAPCVASATRLCLNGNRFAIEVTWKDFSGNTGTGKAVVLTGDTGYFWFFDDDNVELVLKVLDGRPVNNKFWVFYGALSSVEYTITVTDTETDAVKTYKNPSGRLGSVGDTGAF